MRWVVVVCMMLAWPAGAEESRQWRITELPNDLGAYFRRDTFKMLDGEVNLRAVRSKSLAKDTDRAEFYALPAKSPGLRPRPDGLPDGGQDFVLDNISDADVTFAYYGEPTERYPHGALGDDIEAGSLIVGNGQALEFQLDLPENEVFEDRTPRVVDLDGFGSHSIVTILSDQSEGASLAVYGLDHRTIVKLAQTPYIGTPNRWLNIAGIDDFDGSGSSSIALVETPHIGGVLQFWRWSQGELTKIAEAPGFSNHKFGSREQRLSAVEDFDNDGVSDLAVPSADRKSLRLVKVEGGEVVDIATVPLPAPIDKAIGVTRQDDNVVLTIGLEDGSVYAVHK